MYPAGYLTSSARRGLGGGGSGGKGRLGTGRAGPLLLSEEPGIVGTVLVPALCVGVAAGVLASRAYYSSRRSG